MHYLCRALAQTYAKRCAHTSRKRNVAIPSDRQAEPTKFPLNADVPLTTRRAAGANVRPMQTIGVVGAGTMGTGIAQACSRRSAAASIWWRASSRTHVPSTSRCTRYCRASGTRKEEGRHEHHHSEEARALLKWLKERAVCAVWRLTQLSISSWRVLGTRGGVTIRAIRPDDRGLIVRAFRALDPTGNVFVLIGAGSIRALRSARMTEHSGTRWMRAMSRCTSSAAAHRQVARAVPAG